MKESMLIVFVMSGLLFIGVAIPLILRIVPPNWIYGFRVRATLESPDVWYPANWFAGWAMLVVGVLTTLAAVIFYFIPGLGDTEYIIALNIILLTALSGAAIASFWHLRTITRP